jgi:putative DNA primase/helicase
MDELRGYLASLGYSIPNLVLDGKIQRFGRDGSRDSAWLIGWVHHYARRNGSYCIAQFGDWRTGEVHTYIPNGLGGAEKEFAKNVINEAKKKVQIEREVLNKEAAHKAKQRFNSATSEGLTPYNIRKRMRSLYGARIEKENIVVPMRNIEGEIVGTQRITPDGQKFFEKGQKTDGAFFVIGEIDSILCLCEGYATAAAIHESTAYNVVAAFSANNLVKVAKVIRKAYPDIEMIICGDDDFKNEKNVGKEKAEEAGLVSMSAVVLPVFKDARGTDFNDLLVLEGEEAVRAIITQKDEPAAGFRSLGYDDQGHFFYRIDAKDIFKLTSFSPPNLFHLAPEIFWNSNYKTDDKTNYQRAANDLISASIAKGRFDIHSVRGLGVWLDDGKVIVNTGSHLLVNSRELPLSYSEGQYVYVHTHHKMKRVKAVAEVEECADLLNACKMLKFSDPAGRYYLAGWLAIARVAGALPVRPHLPFYRV